MTTDRTAPPDGGAIKQRAQELKTIRDKYKDRAVEYAKVTLPYLVPELAEGTDSQEFQNDYNTEGAKLVNALSNTYVDTLYPAGRSFIKMQMEEADLSALEEQGMDKASVESLFGTVERSFRQRFETVGSRPTMLDCMKHLIVSGNYLLYKPKDGKLSGYAIDEFIDRKSVV